MLAEIPRPLNAPVRATVPMRSKSTKGRDADATWAPIREEARETRRLESFRLIWERQACTGWKGYTCCLVGGEGETGAGGKGADERDTREKGRRLLDDGCLDARDAARPNPASPRVFFAHVSLPHQHASRDTTRPPRATLSHSRHTPVTRIRSRSEGRITHASARRSAPGPSCDSHRGRRPPLRHAFSSTGTLPSPSPSSLWHKWHSQNTPGPPASVSFPSDDTTTCRPSTTASATHPPNMPPQAEH